MVYATISAQTPLKEKCTSFAVVKFHDKTTKYHIKRIKIIIKQMDGEISTKLKIN